MFNNHLVTGLLSFIEKIKQRALIGLVFPQPVGAARMARQINMTLKMMLGITALAFAIVWRFDAGREVGLTSCALIFCGELVLLWCLNRGAIRLAIYGLLAILILVLALAGLAAPRTSGLNAAYFLVLVIATASLVLNFRELIITVLVCLIVIMGLGAFQAAYMTDLNDLELMKMGLLSVGLLIISIGATVAYNSRNLQDALSQSDQHQRVLALRNAELEREVTERQRAENLTDLRSMELQQLLDASRVLSSTLELNPLLDGILKHLHSAVQFDAAVIAELTDPNHYVVLTSAPVPFGKEGMIQTMEVEAIHLHALIRSREPIVINDVFADTPFARAQRARWIQITGALPAYVRSSLLLPLLVRDQIIGYIAIYGTTKDYYTRERVNLGMAFAAQIASAIALVRSHERAVVAAGYSATMAERSRLARELHDSVSQALFGIVLGANTMLTTADAQRPVARDAMVYVLQLAQAGLSEMRALIFELRPEALHAEGLLNVLRKQANALASRHNLEVTTHFDATEPPLSLEVKEALYRIALEAIQNVIKHAEARHIDLTFSTVDSRVSLKVRDDGKGFEPAQSFPGHLGLKTMVERAQLFGGTVHLTSQPGQGTTVAMTMPLEIRPKS